MSRLIAMIEAKPRLTGALLLVASVAGAWLAVTKSIPWPGGDDDTRVRAEFRAAPGLRPGDEVRVRGVRVGEVDAIELQPPGRTARVTMSVRDIAVKDDARADLRWRTVLGGSFYVDLDLGSPSAPRAHDDSFIPRARTTTQVEFDDFLQPLDAPTGTRLRALFGGVREALADPSATHSALRAVRPAMRRLASGLPPLRGTRDGDLRRLVETAAKAAAALDQPADLRGLVADSATTVRTLAEHRGDLARLIDVAAPALDDTRRTLQRVDRTLPLLETLVADLRPGVARLDGTLRSTRPALDRLTRLLDRARPLLAALQPALSALGRVGQHGAPLLDALERSLRNVDERVLPDLADVDPETGRSNFEMIGPTFAAAGDAASEFDGSGHWLRFPPTPDTRSLLALPCQEMLTDPTSGELLRCEALSQVLRKLLSGTARR